MVNCIYLCNMKRIGLIVALMLLVVVVGCKHNEKLPEGVLTVEEYADLLADLYLADGYFSVTNDFQFKNLGADMAGTYDTLLAEHHVTQESIIATSSYYLDHREENKKVYDLLMKKLDSYGNE